jgi:hypothetical protein
MRERFRNDVKAAYLGAVLLRNFVVLSFDAGKAAWAELSIDELSRRGHYAMEFRIERGLGGKPTLAFFLATHCDASGFDPAGGGSFYTTPSNGRKVYLMRDAIVCTAPESRRGGDDAHGAEEASEGDEGQRALARREGAGIRAHGHARQAADHSPSSEREVRPRGGEADGCCDKAGGQSRRHDGPQSFVRPFRRPADPRIEGDALGSHGCDRCKVAGAEIRQDPEILCSQGLNSLPEVI